MTPDESKGWLSAWQTWRVPVAFENATRRTADGASNATGANAETIHLTPGAFPYHGDNSDNTLSITGQFAGGTQYRIRSTVADAIRDYSPCCYDEVVITSISGSYPTPTQGPYVGRRAYVCYKDDDSGNERDLFTRTDLVPEITAVGSGNYDVTVKVVRHKRVIYVPNYSAVAVRMFGKRNADAGLNTVKISITGWDYPSDGKYGKFRVPPRLLYSGKPRFDGVVVGNVDGSNIRTANNPCPDDPDWTATGLFGYALTTTEGALTGPWRVAGKYTAVENNVTALDHGDSVLFNSHELWIPTAGYPILCMEIYDVGDTTPAPDEALAAGAIWHPISKSGMLI